jgi:hypothetical protein
MESLFLLAFGEQEFFVALAMAASEAFFNKLFVALPDIRDLNRLAPRSAGRTHTTRSVSI